MGFRKVGTPAEPVALGVMKSQKTAAAKPACEIEWHDKREYAAGKTPRTPETDESAQNVEDEDDS